MFIAAAPTARAGRGRAVLIDGDIDEGSLGDFDLRGRVPAFGPSFDFDRNGRRAGAVDIRIAGHEGADRNRLVKAHGVGVLRHGKNT